MSKTIFHCAGSGLAMAYRDSREIVRAINEASRLHGRMIVRRPAYGNRAFPAFQRSLFCLLGSDASQIFPAAGLPGIGEVAFGIGVIGGSMLWGYGIWWVLLALLTTWRYLQAGMLFNLGWWGFTFPIGVYAVATLALARLPHIGVP